MRYRPKYDYDDPETPRAFPHTKSNGDDDPGMPLFAYIATKFAAAIIANNPEHYEDGFVAKRACELAEALIEEMESLVEVPEKKEKVALSGNPA